MGQVGLTGAFAGLNLFDGSNPTTFDPSTSTLLSRSPQGAFTALGNTNPGGLISSGCVLNDVYYFVGSFSSVGNTSASNVASYSLATAAFSALGSNGPNGPVNAVYCDSANNNVWIGGHFSSPSPSVAVWSTKSATWSAPPFKGFAGADAEVMTITSNASQTSLFFTGSFITSFSGTTNPPNNSNNPNVPYSSGASPFSSSLVPIPLQGAEIIAAPSSMNPSFSDIERILCPAGPDGPGNTWLAADGNIAVVTVRAFSSISAYGIRLGNTFQNDYGTTAFSVTSIPDNTVQALSYVDPTTGQNMTCADNCPLSMDSAVLYQDFLFDNTVTLTGVQITLSEWKGAAPGLHMLQLLSSGAFASAISSENTQSCFAPNPSNITMTGTWTSKNANTDIPATLQTVLVSTVAVGASSSQAPTFTWMPYVSASGRYDINLIVPGCADFLDCALRTSVQVTVFPGAGSQPYVSTVSQQTPNDAKVLVYSGPIVPSSSSFVTTVSMTLADNPTGNGQNGEYELVAGDIELVLTSANVTGGSSYSGGNGSIPGIGTQRGFGFFEWPFSSTVSVDATGVIPNTSETASDALSLEIYNALAAAVSGSPLISSVVQHPSGVLFLGGNFQFTSGSASGATNIVAYESGALSPLASYGLNGPVTALVLDGNELYIAGFFSDTQSGSMQGKLMGIAMYNVESNSWSALGAGVNGPVSSIALANNHVSVAGNFTEALSAPGISTNAGGFATWDITGETWTNSGGFVAGNLTFVGNSTSSGSQGQSQFVAGRIENMAEYGATGFVMLSNGANGPTVTPFAVQLDGPATNVSGISASMKRRSHHRRGPAAWISHLKFPSLFTRQTTTVSSTLPPAPATPAPAVLVGTFWSNSSSSNEVAIIGGNFSFPTSPSTMSQAIAVYDTTTSSITALAGSQVFGVVRALYVDTESHLYVGGQFNLSDANANGFAIYDLPSQQWLTSAVQPLQAAAGSSVVVRSITSSTYKPNSVVVAGSFAQAGTVTCQGICLLDTTLNQWSALGSGLQGDISSVSYAGNNQELLVAAGSITFTSGTSVNVALYSFANASWTAIGDSTEVPGPVTAVEVNNGNSSSIFAAGRTSDGSSPFMVFWDGVSWSNIGSSLQGNSNISQLLMVPLQNTHSSNGIVESDRMLMISGSLADPSFGSASSLLFDGQSFTPYIASISAQGSMGYISSVFYSIASFSFSQQNFLATGVVILISIAIAAGVVFLLALMGILWTLFSRRDDKIAKYDSNDDEDDDSIQHRPSSLLEHVNAATRTTILGAQSPFNNINSEKEEAARDGAAADPFGPDGSNYLRAETPSDAVIGTMTAEQEFSRPAHARYSFDGAGEGELPLTAGSEVEVLDDRDAAWWYARNPQTGQEGVVPAAYLY
ncbi:cortical protein marker for cell polarity-domain-containing protein [Phlebopus sp. FC_14]|nr:cortical protein marker for cell polarity-domain-containing protein [Phlebopus sp. FC_14]